MSFDSAELADELSGNYERVFDEHGWVMVDNVEDFKVLFEQVSEAVGYGQFQIQIERRPDTAYIHPPEDGK